MPASPREKPGTILILQGGGALGAYECGVYKVLAERLDDLSIIAGTSIGAINVGVIARNLTEPDRGAAALEAFWHDPALAMGTYARVSTPRLIVTAVELEKSQFVPPDDPLPTPGEVPARTGEIIYQERTRSDAVGSQWVTWCRELYEMLEAIPPAVISTLDAPLRSRREQLLTDVAAAKSRIPVTVTYIRRTSLPYEQISSGVDFSVGRIEALIEQGEQDARRAVA